MRVNACVRACVCPCVRSDCGCAGVSLLTPGAAAAAPQPRGSVPRACLQWTVRAAAGSGVWAPRSPPAGRPGPSAAALQGWSGSSGGCEMSGRGSHSFPLRMVELSPRSDLKKRVR